uniref:DOG1 domain-containing protein n=1 Tax=Physcomitrium patens TaxID=3218 RepID=A0A7I4AG32_PHYPA
MEFPLIVDVIDEDMMGDAARLTLYPSKAKVPIDMGDETESKPSYLSIPSFRRFHNVWVGQEDALLSELKAALENPTTEQGFARLVRKCYQHFSEAVNAKIRASHEDVTYVTSGAWKTPLEAGLMWMGGWRPRTAIVLAYSLMGIQIENELQQLLEGIILQSMATLTAKQLARLDAIQQYTSTKEKEISNRLSVLQILVADQQTIRATIADPPSESSNMAVTRDAMEPKLTGLQDLFIEAEKLRLRTLQELFAVLSPIQAAQYIVAAIQVAKAFCKLGEQFQEAHSGDANGRSSRDSGSNVWDIAFQGDVKRLREALDMGLDPSDIDYEGRTPLHLAAGKGHLECVALLVERGAEINVKDNDGVTPLLDALKGGHDEAAKFLRNNGARPDVKDAGNELCKAAACGDMEFLERLVEAGVDPNETDYSQRTPLHIVAAEGTAKDAEFLVHNGADVLAKDRHGYTPVDEARDTNNNATLRVLEAAVLQRQQELDDEDDTSDETSSSSPFDNKDDVDMVLTEEDQCSAC